MLGAEKSGAYLAGGFVEGWEAHALTTLSKAPVPWTADALYAYLRTGFSAEHGVASGPMAPVVAELAGVSDRDIRAMATYLASLNGDVGLETARRAAHAAEARTADVSASGLSVGARLFDGACSACHTSPAAGHEIGVRPSLALNSNVHSAQPDNLIRIILEGIPSPAYAALGDMPAFDASFDDTHLETLVAYIRGRFAPDQPAWSDLGNAIRRVRGVVRRAAMRPEARSASEN
jgi:nicotinate dehydrogenase subunit B